MSQIYSSDGRSPEGQREYISWYSGRRIPLPTGRSRPDTHTSRATTTTKVPNGKQSHPSGTSEARSRSRSQRAPATNYSTQHSTQRSTVSSQSKASTRHSSLAPVARKPIRDDANSTRSGFSGHGAEPGDGPQVGDLSKSNVRALGGSTGGGSRAVKSWVGKSLQSAKPQGSYQEANYRRGRGNRRE